MLNWFGENEWLTVHQWMAKIELLNIYIWFFACCQELMTYKLHVHVQWCLIIKGASICISKPWMKMVRQKNIKNCASSCARIELMFYSVLVPWNLEIRTDSLYSVAISDCSMEDKYSARCHGYDRERIHTNGAVRPRGYTPTQLSPLSIHKHHV